MPEIPARPTRVWRKLRLLIGGQESDEALPDKLPIGGRGFLKDSATTFLTSVFGLVVGTFQAAVVARSLHPVGKGALTAALLLPHLLATLVPLGLNWSATYHLGRGTFDREKLMRSVLTALLLLSGVGVVLCLGIGFAMEKALLSGVPLSAFLLAALLVPTQVTLVAIGSLFRGEMRIVEANRMDLGRAVLMFIGIVVGLRILRLGVTGVILGKLLAEILVIGVAFRRLRGIPARPLLNREILASSVRYGLKVYSFAILLYLNYRFDEFMVRTMLDLKQTGLYATAVGLAEILWMVPFAFGWVLFPSVARSEGEERNRLTLAVCRNASWLMLILCGVLALTRSLVIRLFFGEQFVAAAPALLALLPGILAMAIQFVLGSDLSGRGHPMPVTVAAAFGLTANLLLNLVWIPKYGIVGASLASSVSYSLIALIVTVAFLRISGAKFRDAFVLRREDFGRIAGVFSKMREVAA